MQSSGPGMRLLCVFLLLLAMVVGQDRACPRQPRVVVYYNGPNAYDNQVPLESIPGEKIDVLIYAFMRQVRRLDGTFVLEPAYKDIDTRPSVVAPEPYHCNPGQRCANGVYMQLYEMRRKFPHLKTMVSFPGWTWSKDMSDAVATSESRQAMAQSVCDFIRRYEIDGIDVDWEFPVTGGVEGSTRSPEDGVNLARLVLLIRKSCRQLSQDRGAEVELTVALAANPQRWLQDEFKVDPEETDDEALHGQVTTPAEVFARKCDFVMPMTYEFNFSSSGKVTRPHANFADTLDASDVDKTFSTLRSVKGYRRYFEPEKIVFGIPGYCRKDTGVIVDAARSPVGLGLEFEGEQGELLEWKDALDLKADDGWRRYYDKLAHATYLYNEGKREWASCAGPRDTRHKAQYVKSECLGGLMFWEVGRDYLGDNGQSLLGAITDELFVEPRKKREGRECLEDAHFDNLGCARQTDGTQDAGAESLYGWSLTRLSLLVALHFVLSNT